MASVRKRKLKWVVDYRFNGNRRLKTFSSKTDAQQFKKLIDNEKTRMEFLDIGSAILLKEVINKYFNLFSKEKSTTTSKNEKLYFERLFDFLGNIPVRKIGLADLEEFQSYLSTQVSNASVNRAFNTYKHFFNKCVDWDYLEASPALRLRALRSKAKPRQVWSDHEIQTMIQASLSWYGDALFFLAKTGIRLGEMVGLVWSDVDFDLKRIRIVSRKGSGDEIERFLPLTTELINFLDFKKLQFEKMNFVGSQIVFHGVNGQKMVSEQMIRENRKLRSRLGFKNLTLHGLRHTFITRMAQSGANLEVIRLLVGHRSIKTTQGYLQLGETDLRAAMDVSTEARKVVSLHGMQQMVTH